MTPIPASQDPATLAAQHGASQDESQGTPLAVIEVTIAADGGITVEQESGAQEGQEESGGGEGADTGTAAPIQVKDSTEAASLVKQMIDAATKTTDQQTAQNVQEQGAGYSGQ
jgi:hypothetical protein